MGARRARSPARRATPARHVPAPRAHPPLRGGHASHWSTVTPLSPPLPSDWRARRRRAGRSWVFVNRARRANRSHAALSPSSTVAPANRRAHDSPARSPIGCRLARGWRGPAPSSAGLETWLFLGAGRAGPAARTTRRGWGEALSGLPSPPRPKRNGAVGREPGCEGGSARGGHGAGCPGAIWKEVGLGQLRGLVQPN